MGRIRNLNVVLNHDAIRKILAVGHELDVNKNGLYDARSGCVNIWCSPEDKPICWPKEILQGDLNYPRDYVAGLYWEWNDKNQAKLHIEVEPYELDRQKKDDYTLITDEEWDELFRWSTEKVMFLLNVSGLRFN